MTKARLTNNHHLLPNHETYLRDEIELEGLSILDTIKAAKPTIIIGLSGRGGMFSEEICREMGRINQKPIIFPLSNPSDNAECTAEVAFKATDGRAIFASGSPFPDYTHNGNHLCKANQGNNMFIFPGLGLAAIVGQCQSVSKKMILCAAETLALCMKSEELKIGMVYPDIANIRDVSLEIATCVVEQAIFENLCRNEELHGLSHDLLRSKIKENMYVPEYSDVIYCPP